MTRLTDTSPEAEAVLTDVYRGMPLGQKWLQLGQMYDDARALHAAGVRLRNPSATSQQILEAWLTVNLGFKELPTIRMPSARTPMQNLHDVREVIRILTALEIPYALGGSMASSLYGIDRYTRDADLTAEPFIGKEPQFASSFGPDWYVSLPMIGEALQRRSSFNVINTATGFKVDVFIRKEKPFEQSAMGRRRPLTLPDAAAEPIVVHSAEDVVLFKLQWYRIGNETADQQWKDVVGVLRVQAGKLDDSYLDHWAADLGVADLLQRARTEAVG
jgi:hypothetical protein